MPQVSVEAEAVAELGDVSYRVATRNGVLVSISRTDPDGDARWDLEWDDLPEPARRLLELQLRMRGVEE